MLRTHPLRSTLQATASVLGLTDATQLVPFPSQSLMFGSAIDHAQTLGAAHHGSAGRISHVALTRLKVADEAMTDRVARVALPGFSAVERRRSRRIDGRHDAFLDEESATEHNDDRIVVAEVLKLVIENQRIRVLEEVERDDFLTAERHRGQEKLGDGEEEPNGLSIKRARERDGAGNSMKGSLASCRGPW